MPPKKKGTATTKAKKGATSGATTTASSPAAAAGMGMIMSPSPPIVVRLIGGSVSIVDADGAAAAAAAAAWKIGDHQVFAENDRPLIAQLPKINDKLSIRIHQGSNVFYDTAEEHQQHVDFDVQEDGLLGANTFLHPGEGGGGLTGMSGSNYFWWVLYLTESADMIAPSLSNAAVGSVATSENPNSSPTKKSSSSSSTSTNNSSEQQQHRITQYRATVPVDLNKTPRQLGLSDTNNVLYLKKVDMPMSLEEVKKKVSSTVGNNGAEEKGGDDEERREASMRNDVRRFNLEALKAEVGKDVRFHTGLLGYREKNKIRKLQAGFVDVSAYEFEIQREANERQRGIDILTLQEQKVRRKLTAEFHEAVAQLKSKSRELLNQHYASSGGGSGINKQSSASQPPPTLTSSLTPPATPARIATTRTGPGGSSKLQQELAEQKERERTLAMMNERMALMEEEMANRVGVIESDELARRLLLENMFETKLRELEKKNKTTPPPPPAPQAAPTPTTPPSSTKKEQKSQTPPQPPLQRRNSNALLTSQINLTKNPIASTWASVLLRHGTNETPGLPPTPSEVSSANSNCSMTSNIVLNNAAAKDTQNNKYAYNTLSATGNNSLFNTNSVANNHMFLSSSNNSPPDNNNNNNPLSDAAQQHQRNPLNRIDPNNKQQQRSNMSNPKASSAPPSLLTAPSVAAQQQSSHNTSSTSHLGNIANKAIQSRLKNLSTGAGGTQLSGAGQSAAAGLNSSIFGTKGRTGGGIGTSSSSAAAASSSSFISSVGFKLQHQQSQTKAAQKSSSNRKMPMPASTAFFSAGGGGTPPPSSAKMTNPLFGL